LAPALPPGRGGGASGVADWPVHIVGTLST